MKAIGKSGWMWLAAVLLCASPAWAQRQIVRPAAPAIAPAPAVAVPVPVEGFGAAGGAFGVPAPAFAPADPAAHQPAALDRVRVTLADNSQLIGEVIKGAKFEFKSKFGKLNLQIDEITRIEPVSDNQFVVTLENGDRMTGEVAFAELKLKTAFGEVPMEREDFAGLEVGKLYEQRVGIVRSSPDGRTSTTVFRDQKSFQPNAPATNISSPYNTYGVPNGPTYYAPTVTAPIAPIGPPRTDFAPPAS